MIGWKQSFPSITESRTVGQELHPTVFLSKTQSTLAWANQLTQEKKESILTPKPIQTPDTFKNEYEQPKNTGSFWWFNIFLLLFITA